MQLAIGRSRALKSSSSGGSSPRQDVKTTMVPVGLGLSSHYLKAEPRYLGRARCQLPTKVLSGG